MNETASRQAILHKTNYGLSIYSYIIRSVCGYPSAMSIVGRDCGLNPNPFDEGRPTLHIWIDKPVVNGNASDPEIARHSDSSATIPDGDVFDFAARFFNASGDELLAHIDNALELGITKPRSFYSEPAAAPLRSASPPSSTAPTKAAQPLFSFFRAPIKNTKPCRTISVLDAYTYIIGDTAATRTAALREILSHPGTGDPKVFKATNFDYCTFSGTFTARGDKNLIEHSGLLCVDFDHVADLAALRASLLNDEYFDTALLFRSPSGDGIKWVVEVDLSQYSHGEYFQAVAAYLLAAYGVEADRSGRDVSRACFLPHDKDIFINPKFLSL